MELLFPTPDKSNLIVLAAGEICHLRRTALAIIGWVYLLDQNDGGCSGAAVDHRHDSGFLHGVRKGGEYPEQLHNVPPDGFAPV